MKRLQLDSLGLGDQTRDSYVDPDYKPITYYDNYRYRTIYRHSDTLFCIEPFMVSPHAKLLQKTPSYPAVRSFDSALRV